jgi:hypothetical protein
MRKAFAPLDDVLIERLFQPMSDLVLNRIGVGRGAATCFCIDLASLSWIASRARGLSDAVTAWDCSAAFVDLLLLLLGLVAMVSLRILFRRARGKLGNPLRMIMRPHRLVVLLMLVARLAQFQAPDLADAADVAMLVFATSALYFGACSERPPIRRGGAALVPAR